jgi:hypothetical protein
MEPTVTLPFGITPDQYVSLGIFCLMGVLTFLVGVLMVVLVFMRRPRSH